MSIGDFSDTTTYWTGTPPLIYSAAKVNTMFLNAWRLLKGAERIPCQGMPANTGGTFDDYRIGACVPCWGGPFTENYMVILNQPHPWDRIILNALLYCDTAGLGNIGYSVDVRTTVAGPVTNLASGFLNGTDYSVDTWATVYDGTLPETAMCYLLEVTWTPGGLVNIFRSRLGHVILASSHSV